MEKKTAFSGWMRRNSLFLKIVTITTAAILIVGVLISFFVIQMSEKIYIDTYAQANNKVITQVQSEYARLNEDIVSLLTTCSGSYAVSRIISGSEMNVDEQYSLRHQMRSQIESAASVQAQVTIHLILAGTNGETFVRGDARLTKTAQEILETDAVREAMKQPNLVLYAYTPDGFTTATKGQSCILVAKSLWDRAENRPYGAAVALLTQSDFSSLYRPLVDGTINRVYVLTNEDGMVISSNAISENGKHMKELNMLAEDIINGPELYRQQKSEDGLETTVLAKELTSYGFRLTSVINETALLNQMYRPQDTLLVCAVIIALVMLILFFTVRKSTRPITNLARRMPEIVGGDFSRHIEVKGGGEARELAEAFNHMLDGLNDYVSRLVTLQEEKRLAEIHALQMQINPHFMYNTLACIKFLIWQGSTEKSTQTIDAFINLLRNTISNEGEMVAVQQEIDNLKNYALIQQARYGDKVNIAYSIAEGCETLEIPKMLLQPFVENAFFHAFSSRAEGRINVFVRRSGGRLICEIMDNGVGMSREQLDRLWSRDAQKGHPFTGIGVRNVNDRINLLYGEGYGVHISSNPGEGTIVKITIPARDFIG